MALSQVGSSILAESSGFGCSLPVPASLATNDLVIAAVHLFGSASVDTVTAPAGFTEIAEAHILQTSTDTTGDHQQIRAFWKWYAGESGTYAFSWPHNDVFAAGCDVIRGAPTGGSGDPIDHVGVSAAATTYGGSLPAASQVWTLGTLLQANEWLVAFMGSDQGGNVSTPGIFTSRQNEADFTVMDASRTSAGAQGTTTIVQNLAADQILVTVPVLATAVASPAATPPHRSPLWV
jgi:hypothetical protein